MAAGAPMSATPEKKGSRLSWRSKAKMKAYAHGAVSGERAAAAAAAGGVACGAEPLRAGLVGGVGPATSGAAMPYACSAIVTVASMDNWRPCAMSTHRERNVTKA